MPPAADEDDFGFDSSDEADLLAVADGPPQDMKRKSPFEDVPPSKRRATDSAIFHCAVNALAKSFGKHGRGEILSHGRCDIVSSPNLS